MTVWKLRSGADRRIRGGHPWIFSNELEKSPKGHVPGAPVTLQDAKGSFLAHGYGNPHSLIAFRAVSFDSKAEDCLETEALVGKAISAWGHRSMLGYRRSFRCVFGEGDSLPGLVIDRYKITGDRQVLAIQVLTAGMDAALKDIEFFARRFVEESVDSGLSEIGWAQTAVVLRADVNIRKLEGLAVLEPKVVHAVEGLDLSSCRIELDPIDERDERAVEMDCNLFDGQKTGFFLDQGWNIRVAGQFLRRNPHLPETVRILDLCCYVGQWSSQLARLLTSAGHKVEVELVDVSAQALAFAVANSERSGAQALPRELDVLEGLSILPDRHYDIVIADPPAFMKAKKDLPTAKHAYLKFNTQAFRVAKRGGLVVSCSCSGLFPDEDLRDVIRKAAQRHQIFPRGVGRGGHAADHPTLPAFPEGNYLKMYLHQVAMN